LLTINALDMLEREKINVLRRFWKQDDTEAHLADHDGQSGNVDVLIWHWQADRDQSDIVMPGHVDTIVHVDTANIAYCVQP